MGYIYFLQTLYAFSLFFLLPQRPVLSSSRSSFFLFVCFGVGFGWFCCFVGFFFFLTDNYRDLCTAVASPISCHPMPVFTYGTFCIPTSQDLCSHTRAAFLCTTTSCEYHKYLILPTITAYYCYPYKTGFVPYNKHE